MLGIFPRLFLGFLLAHFAESFNIAVTNLHGHKRISFVRLDYYPVCLIGDRRV